MGSSRAGVICSLRAGVVAICLSALGLAGGCQTAAVATAAKLAEHRQQVDEVGLVSEISVEALKASIAPPSKWVALKVQKTLLYTHQQWRSPSRKTAVGVTYAHMPFAMSTKTLAWFARNEARKQSIDGQLIREWTDSLGREWFEAETDKYHILGYIMTSGCDAWVNYCGYRTTESRAPAEMELGRRAMDTVVPLSVANQIKATAMAR
jgi:hypothetical protein